MPAPAKMLTIRQARVSDARQLDNFLGRTFQAGRHIITAAHEFQPGFLTRRLWIARKALNPLETCLVAIQDGKIVAMLECWTDARIRVRHISTFFMAVDPDMQRRGIGKTLLGTYINWVRTHPHLLKIELHVHDDNEGAKALYERIGFVFEGRRAGAIHYEDGRIIDDLLMALWPNGERTATS